ncbi:MAG: hypothetical protein ACJ763_04975 [Bdellovibrionia bacterium]
MIKRWYWQAALSTLFFVFGFVSLSARSDVRSKDPKDPYSLRYSKVAKGRTVLELCGPKGCRVLGPIELDLDSEEIDGLRNQEKYQYYSNEVAAPVVWIALPGSGIVRGVAGAKFTLKVTEKILPFVTKKLFQKFGTEATLTGVKVVSSGVNVAQMVPMTRRIVDEFMNTDQNKAALEVLSDRAVHGDEVHVDFSIEQLARHLEAEFNDSQKIKELIEEKKEKEKDGTYPYLDWQL